MLSAPALPPVLVIGRAPGRAQLVPCGHKGEHAASVISRASTTLCFMVKPAGKAGQREVGGWRQPRAAACLAPYLAATSVAVCYLIGFNPVHHFKVLPVHRWEGTYEFNLTRQEMLRGIVSFGGTGARARRALHKLATGQPLRVAFLGGSITR